MAVPEKPVAELTTPMFDAAAVNRTHGYRLKADAHALERAVRDFRPDTDFLGGLERMVAAVARANRTYLKATGENLVRSEVRKAPQITIGGGEPPSAA